MDAGSIDKILDTLEELPRRLPGVSEQFVNESRRYWLTIRRAFFDETESQSGYALSRFRCYDDYQTWYAGKAYPILLELHRSQNHALKVLVKYLYKIFRCALNRRVVVGLPLMLDVDGNLCLMMPDGSREVVRGEAVRG